MNISGRRIPMQKHQDVLQEMFDCLLKDIRAAMTPPLPKKEYPWGAIIFVLGIVFLFLGFWLGK